MHSKILIILAINMITSKMIDIKELSIEAPINYDGIYSAWSVQSNFEGNNDGLILNKDYDNKISILHNTLMLYSNIVKYDLSFEVKIKQKKINTKSIVFAIVLDNKLREISYLHTNSIIKANGVIIIGALYPKNILKVSIIKTNKKVLKITNNDFDNVFKLLKNEKTINLKKNDKLINLKIDLNYLKNYINIKLEQKVLFKIDNLTDFIPNQKSCFHLYSISPIDIPNKMVIKKIKVSKSTNTPVKNYNEDEYNNIVTEFKSKLTKVNKENPNFFDVIKNQNKIEVLTNLIKNNMINIGSKTSELKSVIEKDEPIIFDDLANNERYKDKISEMEQSFNDIMGSQNNIRDMFKSLNNIISNLGKINEFDYKLVYLDSILKELDIIINLNQFGDIINNIKDLSNFIEGDEFNKINEEIKEHMVKKGGGEISPFLLFVSFIVLSFILSLIIITSYKINKAEKSHYL